jgi:hypothetical protein
VKQKEADIQQVVEGTQPSLSSIAPGEIIIGTLKEIDGQGQPLVDFPENKTAQPLVAMSTLGLTQAHINRQVALLFANGDLHRPVIMGMIHSPLDDMLENFDQAQITDREAQQVELESDLNVDDVLIDGKKIVFEAKEEIVLKCGESSITLTKAGKVLIRGKYLLNRSTGVNRIMGGSVQVN